MPSVGASYLMTKYDNERVQVVPDSWLDRLCPISDEIDSALTPYHLMPAYIIILDCYFQHRLLLPNLHS